MPLLDTSFIIRYLTGDPPELARRAAEIIDSGEDFIITDVVIVETAFVLTRLYEVERPMAVDTLIAFIQQANLKLDNMDKSYAYKALLLCRPSNRVSFADAFIWAAVKQKKESVIYSFDKRFPREEIEVRS